ncbi:deoxyribodipyrimidine photo-lyase [Zooshikella ganghwensis]|uniref:Deoxyribodipyrimidine photo-lyase n=1 Tax=Zooshikella ganghwensis TaxID=202772 RepID=A0A4P9VLU7_9GAMM|nr:deoxyribodipyrimidine photo-lyase [Zooshikella ganghwensis]RDH43327.1 deoxyribodipyrimidine photo-lyase [Zooshikella ganghwensis]
MTSLVWFRNDLRVQDNTALYHASMRGPVIAVYCLYPAQWQQHNDSPNKIKLALATVKELQQQLQLLNIPLIIKQLNHFDDTAQYLMHLALQLKCSAVTCNEEYGANEQKRDQQVAQMCISHGLHFEAHTDAVVCKPGSLLTKQGEYYKVYSQFRRSFIAEFYRSPCHLLPMPQTQRAITVNVLSDGFDETYTQSAVDNILQCWPPGESAAQQRLNHFLSEKAVNYKTDRDFPAVTGTSQLSAYLTLGIISLRQCIITALQHNEGQIEGGNPGIECWINELIWREFYIHILCGYPAVSKHKPFKSETDNLAWQHDTDLFEAWCQGKTGYPIVDAAMKQLVQTGWMHNRLRMITAMFLTKDLFIDWRLGEAFFMQHLVDGDLAANNGGWQWSASTGTDAAPYFRIFNPTTQGQRFAPEGTFIRQYLPALADVPNKRIHEPYKGLSAEEVIPDYPRPIVDHSVARVQTIAAFKELGT